MKLFLLLFAVLCTVSISVQSRPIDAMQAPTPMHTLPLPGRKTPLLSDEQMNRLLQKAIANGEPTPEGSMFLEYRSEDNSLRQYVTISASPMGELQRIDWISESWRKDNERDVIDQRVVSLNVAQNKVRSAHELITEDRSAIVSDEVLPFTDAEIHATVNDVTARFVKLNSQ